MSKVLSVNMARILSPLGSGSKVIRTGIEKAPTSEAVAVRAPGPRRDGAGSGLLGDTIGNHKVHGGDDQAVYAYSREDLDYWEAHLGRALPHGAFGENLTTLGVDVTHARIGERWRIGTDGLLLEVSSPRTPCRTFAAFLGVNRWIKTFTEAARPGAYLRVLAPGTVRAGDAVSVEHRPEHDVTVELAFRARMTEPDLLPRLLAADALSAEWTAYANRRQPGLT